MEVSGKIKMLGETKTVGTGGFLKRELIVTTDEQYPQHILVEFVQDKCELLDKVKEGNSVKVSINLRGREWVDPHGVTKYFNQIQGWRIEKLESNEPAAELVSKGVQEGAVYNANEQPDDLAF